MEAKIITKMFESPDQLCPYFSVVVSNIVQETLLWETDRPKKAAAAAVLPLPAGWRHL